MGGSARANANLCVLYNAALPLCYAFYSCSVVYASHRSLTKELPSSAAPSTTSVLGCWEVQCFYIV